MKKLLVFLLLGFFLLSLLGYFCAYKIFSPAIEADIKNRAKSSLIRNNLASIEVEVDGRDITLKGTVSSKELKAKALRVAAIDGYHTIEDKIIVTQGVVSNDLSHLKQDQKISNDKIELVKEVDFETSDQQSSVFLKNEAAKNCQKNFNDLLSKNKIQFKTGRAVLAKESFTLLDEFVQVITSCPKAVILIEGYTDSKGLEKNNKKLSHKRAKAVANYLQEKGITEENLKTKGYGEEKPIATNRTSKGRALNRRIEFTVEGVE